MLMSPCSQRSPNSYSVGARTSVATSPGSAPAARARSITARARWLSRAISASLYSSRIVDSLIRAVGGTAPRSSHQARARGHGERPVGQHEGVVDVLERGERRQPAGGQRAVGGQRRGGVQRGGDAERPVERRGEVDRAAG